MPVGASPSLQSNIVELSNAPFSSNEGGIDITSDGTLFLNANQSVYRSTNRGASFTAVLTLGAGNNSNWILRTDSRNYVFAGFGNGSGTNIYRSVDLGETWNAVLEQIGNPWRMTETSNGTLLMNTYITEGDDLIWKSDDAGASWSVWQNLTYFGNDHIHCVRVNPFNDDIWVACGDKVSGPANVARWNYGASEWTLVHNTTSQELVTDFLFDEDYAYLLPDVQNFKVRRIPHRGVWSDHEDVMDLYYDDTTSPSGFAYSMMGAMYADSLMVLGTDRETVFASVDGRRWLKIFQSEYQGSGAWRIVYLSQKDRDGYWYFRNKYSGVYYRAHITADMVRQQIHLYYNEYFGTIATEQIQVPVENDTYVSIHIDSDGVQSFSVSAFGLGVGNFLENPSFETGNLSGWTVGGTYTTCEVTSAEPFNGTYSLEVTKAASSPTFWTHAATPVHASEYGEILFGSISVKANYTEIFTGPEFKIEVGYYVNEVWTPFSSYSWYMSDGWQRFSYNGRSSADRDLYVRFITWCYSFPYTLWIDSAVYERKVENYRINEVDDGDTFVYKVAKSTPTATAYFYDSYTDASNVQIAILGYGTLNHAGILSEWEQTAAKSFGLSDTTFDIYVNVEGSEQIMLRLEWNIIVPKSVVQTYRTIFQASFVMLAVVVLVTAGGAIMVTVTGGGEGGPEIVFLVLFLAFASVFAAIIVMFAFDAIL